MLIVHSHIYMYLVCVNHMRLKDMELPLPLSFQTCYLVPFDIIFGLFVHMRL
jgi:hypothetical protein